MPKNCKNKVIVDYKPNGDPITTRCGFTAPDGKVALCDACQAYYEEKYCQGWVRVPGDVCKHGNYVGEPGGADVMCFKCEQGE